MTSNESGKVPTIEDQNQVKLPAGTFTHNGLGGYTVGEDEGPTGDVSLAELRAQYETRERERNINLPVQHEE